MGTSIAIIGAYCLAGELSKFDLSANPAQALQAYDDLFRPFTEDAQYMPKGMPGAAHPASSTKLWLLRSIIAMISKGAWLYSKLPSRRRIQLDAEVKEDFKLPRYKAFEDLF